MPPDPKQPFFLFLPDPEATHVLGQKLAKLVLDTHHTKSLLVLLSGPLGAGKTTLVQGIAEGLKVKEIVNSPTFTSLNEYHSGVVPLFHLDLYRWHEGQKATLDFMLMEIEELLSGKGIVIIEWAEVVQSFLNHPALEIKLEYFLPQGRKAILKGQEEKEKIMAETLASAYF